MHIKADKSSSMVSACTSSVGNSPAPSVDGEAKTKNQTKLSFNRDILLGFSANISN